ncbi:ABC transporter substrate-binding protein [Pseudolysinimonas sp.]|uniref:ABC transporter substrate-binding protein n=1 Tax=Pseudolysinimonas sp. TaxID=2680009 RepID=UPI003F7FBED6
MSKRRMLAAALVCALAIPLALAGCTSGGAKAAPEPAKVSGDLTIWVYPYIDEAAWWKDAVARFTKKFSKVDVKVVVQPWADRDTQLTTAIAGGNGPDLVYFIPDQIGQYASQGLLADVGDVTSWSRYSAPAVEGVSWDGTKYGLPILQSVSSLLIYKPAFAAAGITEYPTTWAEALEDAPALQKAGYYLTDYYGSPAASLNLSFYPILWQAGGDVLNKDSTKCTLNNKAGLAALTFLKKIFDNGWADKEYITAPPDQNTPTLRGKVAMLFSTASGTLMQSGVKPGDDWISAKPLKDVDSVTYGAVGSLGLLDQSKHKEAAEAFLRWFSSQKETEQYVHDRSYFSPLKATKQMYDKGSLQGGEEAQLSIVKTGVSAPNSRRIMDLIRPQIQAALLGTTPPQKALDQACTDVDGILKK